MGTTTIHKIYLNISHIQTKCGKYHGIFCGLLLVPHNIVMDLNNVMLVHIDACINQQRFFCLYTSLCIDEFLIVIVA